MTAKKYCAQHVYSGGRDVGGHQCTKAAVKGAYCRYHAKQHETAKPTLVLWSRELALFDTNAPLPKRELVREIGVASFIDARGRRHPLRDQYNAYYRTEAEALAATQEALCGMVEVSKRRLSEALAALAIVKKRSAR